jgi:hypothetical protein
MALAFTAMNTPQARMEQALVVITLSTATLVASFGLLVMTVLMSQ